MATWNKLSLACGLAIAAIGLAASTSSAAIYTDASSENHDGNAHMDITSVEVTNTDTTVSFTINLRGAITGTTNWGKYAIGIDSKAGGNSTQDDTGNAWSRSISMPGMDYWIGSWVDGTPGANQSEWTGTAWSGTGSPTNVPGTTSLTLTTTLASIGLPDGGTFKFDVYTTGGGGGDGANDALSNSAQASPDWGTHYDSGTNVSTYVAAVPEPASVGLLGVAAVGLLRRRRFI